MRVGIPAAAAVLVAFALLAHGISWREPKRINAAPHLPVRFLGHWMLGLQHLDADADDINVRTSFEGTPQPGSATLKLHVQTSHPVHVVARSPAFVRLRRTTGLPTPPVGSVYIDRPPLDNLIKIDTNCLRTREPKLRTANASQWSVETVVLFLDSPHFGRAWQTVRVCRSVTPCLRQLRQLRQQRLFPACPPLLSRTHDSTHAPRL
jgi:hypothetical protein